MLRSLFLSSLACALLGIAPSVLFAAGPTYTDPAKADVFEKGIADMQKSKTDLKEKAKALLQKM